MPGNDKFREIDYKLDSIKVVMIDNIDRVLENWQKIETIAESAENLNQSAALFHKGSKELRNKMWWKNFRTKLMIGGSITTITLVIILVAVGVSGGFNKKN